ncbi:MAG: hypothetical protein GVY08_11320 [Bacteroidetes bacterium]|jgi:hypothetical protein|nr:hypothetical protein [Bacteroidota bacterium]
MRISQKIILPAVIALLSTLQVQAQQLDVVAETDQFTEYHFSNDSLEIVHAYEFLTSLDIGSAYQITRQVVETKTINRDPEPLIEAFALSDSDTPLFDLVNPGVRRGESVASLRFHPVRFDAAAPGQFIFVKEARFRVYKRETRPRRRLTPNAELADDSPLRAGEWYKIPVEQKGIHELDFDYLAELGVNTGQINPEQLQIWATPGGELPRLNSG